ncbi:ABC transporter ATP-binding protein [Cytobacillus purgationiresistens]|uniref:ATP-binding cassette subfamily B protein n=1 Tax=Cytobacillus purgationiresistens TaxID=863449 RepID=A0ABU0AS62_9BACI|nr:ABC transporter ATP-binding protein [Cytobacillus purgationiresistens]MDQ0273621.1 ATP-binding cassette subfamily B protein [Cytobacillus purgationiresistens]
MLTKLSEPFKHKKIPLQSDGALIETKGKKSKPKNASAVLMRIWMYLAYSKRMLFLVLLMVVVSSALALLGPFLVGVAIDQYLVTREGSYFVRLLIALGVIYIIHSLSLWLQNFWMIGVAQETVYSMRADLFQQIQKLPIPFFDKRQLGELMSRVTNDIENVSSTLNSSIIQIFSSVLTLVGTIAVMLWLSPLLTLLTLIIVPLMFYGMKWITKRTSKLFKEQQRNLGELNGFIEETISGQKIIKTFSQEQKVINEFIEKGDRLKNSGFWAQTYSGFIPKLMNMLNNLSFAIIAGVGGVLALNGAVSIGVIVIFTEYSRQFTRPLNDLANQFNTLFSAIAGAERVFDIIDEQDELKQELNKRVLEDVKGEVEFRDVSFAYEGNRNTLNHIDLLASPGQTIAFVGPTGAGKTTIINLLSRFYEVNAGTILIDGIDISTIKKESLRKHMGFVLQDSFLFQGTVRENIRYGRLEATDEEVIEAAKLANAHSFIMKLPNQYDTALQNNGNGISQGQKQLISIARAFLAQPSILVLDEATSSIDTVTELKIQEALQQLMKGRTSFVIAHRLNTIQNADRIFVLQSGKIIEEGTHANLLREKGFYYQLHGKKQIG